MIKNWQKRLICLIGGMAMILSSFSIPFVKSKAETKVKTINLINDANPSGGIRGGSVHFVYFGKDTTEDNYFNGCFKVLDANNTNTGEAGMFLLSDKLLGEVGTDYGNTMFNDSDNYNTVYQGSNAQNWCNNFLNNTFSEQERVAMIKTYKSDDAYTAHVTYWSAGEEHSYDASYYAVENILNGDQVFPMSAEEADNTAYGFTTNSSKTGIFNTKRGFYWLRSVYTGITYNCGDVCQEGRIGYINIRAAMSMRPAFNLDTSKVIFTTAVSNAKNSGEVGENCLLPVDEYTGKNWKLTIKDDSRDSFKVTDADYKDGVVAITYSGAKSTSETLGDEYLSAIIVNSDGVIVYYGNVAKLEDEASSSGVVSLNLVDKLNEGDKLYVFNEQVNGDFLTDYSSSLCEIDLSGKSYKPVSPIPTLTQTSKGVKVSWEADPLAEGYCVFRKVEGGSWKVVAKTNDLSYEDTTGTPGKNTSYAVRCTNADGSKYTSSFDNNKVATIEFPVLSIQSPLPVLSEVSGKIQITWTAVTGSPKYRIFRQAEGGSWKKLADVSTTTYTDTTGVGGTNYTYAIRCLSSDGKLLSPLDKKKLASITYPAGELVSPMPTLTSVNDGIEIGWAAVSGSPNYRIFRKVEGGSWKKLADVSTTTFTDTTGTEGKTYTFAIRCLAADGTTLLSKFDSTKTADMVFPSKSIVSPKPTLTAQDNGVFISWTAVPGVAKYRVYKKTGTGSWKVLTESEDLSCTDTKCTEGTEYSYAVRCLDADGNLISKFDNAAVSSITR